jgi:hypothetical protein
MDAKLKADWVKALRSGEYKQGKDCLKSDFGHCCLGVLCEISGEASWTPRNTGIYKCSIGDSASVSFLPAVLARKVEISPEETDSLIRMNDDGTKFAEIADYIEQNL